MQIKNISGNDLDVIGVGPVKAGEKFEAAGDLAKSLLAQKDNFERVDDDKKGHKS